MSFVLPSPLGGHPVPIVAVAILLAWLFLTLDTGRRWPRRAAVAAYLSALALIVGECVLWFVGRR